MKYILFEHVEGHDSRPLIPFIFPEQLVHADVAASMLRTQGMQGYRPIRAGFVDLGLQAMGRTLPLTCHGESETLGLKSDPEDARILDRYEYGGKFGLVMF